MSQKIKRIAVYTSGGDAPGMNAAVRAVVRTCAHHNIESYKITAGYEGMMDGHLEPVETRAVGNIMQRGGTVLKTARSERFMTPEGRALAAKSLKKFKIDALVALGGNGTFTGAEIFHKEHGIPVIGVPCTIDNDLYGTDFTIGFDTALNTAVEAVDKIRDTAESHDRVFFVEVMGRNSGFLALHTAIASGASVVLLPEKELSFDQLEVAIAKGVQRKKLFSLIIVAEGNTLGKTEVIAEEMKRRIGAIDARVSVIGHLQRGGSPSGADRLLASRLGNSAVEGLLDGHTCVMVGVDGNSIKFTPMGIAIRNQKEINLDMLRLADVLAQ